MKNYIKNKLPPYVRRPLGYLFNRAREVTTTPFTHETIAALVKKTDPAILEIGCNDGSDTLGFLRVMPRAKIYCFEPDPRAIARFKNQLGSCLDKVKLFEVAVSDRPGRIDFHTSSGCPPWLTSFLKDGISRAQFVVPRIISGKTRGSNSRKS